MTEKHNAKDAAAQLPLSPPMFHVLLALADGEKHGYAIMKDVALRTDGKVKLSAGTLYGIVARLLTESIIAKLRRRPVPALDDERRRYYQLTEFGRRVAIAEVERMEEALALARSKRLLARVRMA